MKTLFKLLPALSFLLILFFYSEYCFSQDWTLVWSDEFDSGSIDKNTWIHETGGGGWGNNELEYYTNRAENSYIQDGKLVIKAIKENYSNRSYTSARLKTQGKKFWKYGKIEARLKLPQGQGIWPAFWMLGQNISTVGWPKCGEIDIMEMIGGQGREKTVHGTLHWDNNGQHEYEGKDYSLSSGTFADSFHVYSIEWDELRIKWLIDNKQYYYKYIIGSDLSEFHEEFFILLNLAVGGNWPGSPNSSTVFPQYYEIDYVRVYQKLISGVEDEGFNSPDYHLEQNYPNPFNPETNFGFRISSASGGGLVNLKIHDVLGNEVATLINEEKPAGEYSVKFDAAGLSSGVYYYTLRSGAFSSTKKMIVIK